MANLKSILKAGFPFISAGLGMAGPIGAVAQGALGSALGISKPNPSIDDLESAFGKVPPEQLSGVIERMKAADRQFQLDAEKMGFADAETMAKIDADDRASARQRQAVVRDYIPGFLAVSITLGFFGMLALMMKFPPPAANEKLLDIMLGSLGTAWIGVTSYYFGSSRGSDRKTELLAGNAKS